MTTRAEKINQINEDASKFLGFTTELAGLSKMSFEKLDFVQERMHKALGVYELSKELQSLLTATYGKNCIDSFAIFGSGENKIGYAIYKNVVLLTAEAQYYWETLTKTTSFNKEEATKNLFPETSEVK